MTLFAVNIQEPLSSTEAEEAGVPFGALRIVLADGGNVIAEQARTTTRRSPPGAATAAQREEALCRKLQVLSIDQTTMLPPSLAGSVLLILRRAKRAVSTCAPPGGRGSRQRRERRRRDADTIRRRCWCSPATWQGGALPQHQPRRPRACRGRQQPGARLSPPARSWVLTAGGVH